MSILIKDVLLDGKTKDIYIEGNFITEINDNINIEADFKINASGNVVLPSFANSHTHAAMTLVRSYADDFPVKEWLEQKIWPFEAKLTEEMVYWGAKLACLEMIKSGTTFFNDMYHFPFGTAKAVKEMGIRSLITEVYFDKFEKEWETRKKIIIDNINKIKEMNCTRVTAGLGPHAIYTVSEEGLKWAKEFADKNNLFVHIHLSETKKEVIDCVKEKGMRPIEYLESIGFLGPNIAACHCIWLNDKEIEILARNNAKIVYNPTSNMKLGSGVLQYMKLKQAGLVIGLGTDGCASNNNLDMIEEMKFASLLQKSSFENPTLLHAKETFALALNGYKIFGIDAGEVKEGKLADLILIDLKNIHFIPNYNLISNLVYSANGSCVDTTICDGKILMRDGKVEGEEEVRERVKEIVKEII